MEDLWGFTKESLEEDETLINKVLKEQAELLGKKTGGILRGKVRNRMFKAQEETLLETAFEVVVPNLDNYVTILFYVYAKPERNFPAIISLVRIPETTFVKKGFYCLFNELDFTRIKSGGETKEKISEVLHNKEVIETIGVLYQKGK